MDTRGASVVEFAFTELLMLRTCPLSHYGRTHMDVHGHYALRPSAPHEHDPFVLAPNAQRGFQRGPTPRYASWMCGWSFAVQV